jgi:hypothetical protein
MKDKKQEVMRLEKVPDLELSICIGLLAEWDTGTTAVMNLEYKIPESSHKHMRPNGIVNFERCYIIFFLSMLSDNLVRIFRDCKVYIPHSTSDSIWHNIFMIIQAFFFMAFVPAIVLAFAFLVSRKRSKMALGVLIFFDVSFFTAHLNLDSKKVHSLRIA